MPPKKKKNRGDGGDNLDAKELAREYGFGWKFFKQTPELWKLLQQATRQNWGPSRFEAEFKATDWYKKHADVYRQNMGLKFSDPASFRDRLAESRARVENVANQWGARLTKRELDKYSRRALIFGWDDGQLLNFLGKEVRPDKAGHYQGELSGIEQNLRQLAKANGVSVGRKQMTHWMREIVRGNADMREYENYIRKIAARTYTAYADEINAGMDVVDIAAPYIQTMASVLELNPAGIDVTDRTIRRALSFKNKKGEAIGMSLSDFEDSLRADKRWQYTDQAHELMRGYAVELGQMWGVL